MPTALSDPSSTLYIILGIITIVLAAIWIKTPKRNNLIQLLIGAAVLAVVFIVDTTVESPREQSVRKMNEMALATRERKLDDLLKHVSDAFESGSVKKADMRPLLESVQQRSGFEWKGGEVWGFTREDFSQLDGSTLTIGFSGQASGFPVSQHYCVATFRKEGDEWRMVTIKFHDPLQGKNGPAKTLSELARVP